MAERKELRRLKSLVPPLAVVFVIGIGGCERSEDAGPGDVVRLIELTLDSEEPPPLVTVKPGRLTTLAFADDAGSRWPIEEIAEPATDALLVERARSRAHVATLRVLNETGPANIVVFLKGLDAPVHLDVTDGGAPTAARLEIRVARAPRSNPGSGEIGSVAAFPADASMDAIIRDYLLANPDVLREALDPKRQLAAQASRLRAEFLGAPGLQAAGDLEAPLTVVEFFDYRCGFCKRSMEAVSAALARPGVRVELREYPILGDESLRASRLALAAGLQGRYLEAHLALMEREQGFGEEVIDELADALGLDAARLRADMESQEVQAMIDANRNLARRLGVTGTPAFFVAGPERIEVSPGALDAAGMSRLLDAAG